MAKYGKGGSGITSTTFSDAICKPKGGTASPAPVNPNSSKKGK